MGVKGLLRALEEVYPFVKRQGCWFHKMQNVVSKVQAADRQGCAQGLRQVYEAGGEREAVKRYQAWAVECGE